MPALKKYAGTLSMSLEHAVKEYDMKVLHTITLLLVTLIGSTLGYAMDTNENIHENTSEPPTKKQKTEDTIQDAQEGTSNSRSTYLFSQEEIQGHSEELFTAAADGDVEKLYILLTKGMPVDLVDNNQEIGRTALAIAARAGQQEAVELLIRNGANIDTQDTNGATPLHLALLNGHINLLQTLCFYRADTTLADNNGNLALHLAATQANVVTFYGLLQATPANLINAQNNAGQTPLALALERNNIGTAQVLFRHNAAIGNSANQLAAIIADGHVEHLQTDQQLLYYILIGDIERANHLLQTEDPLNYIDTVDDLDMTILHWAAARGYHDVVEFLLRAEADIDNADIEGMQPLHFAAQNGHRTIMKLLLAHGALVNARDRHGQTPLHYAILRGDRDSAEILIAAHADINAQNARGQSSLHLAALTRNLDLALFLINRNTSINVRDNEGFTPLTVAIINDNLTVIRALLYYNADITEPSNDSYTAAEFAEQLGRHDARALLMNPIIPPLLYAVMTQNEELVHRLLEQKNIDIAATDGMGTTALSMAVQMGNANLVNLLLKYGVQMHQTNLANRADSQGFTPLHHAAGRGQPEIVRALLNHGAHARALTRNNETPAELAQANNQSECLEILRAHILRPFLARSFRAGERIEHLRETPSNLPSNDTRSPIAIAGGDENIMKIIATFLVHQTMHHNPNNNNN